MVQSKHAIESTIRSKEFSDDRDLQLRTLERIFSIKDSPEMDALLNMVARRMGVNVSRLCSVMELTSTMDRLKALGLPPDRRPMRLDEDKVFPTTGWFGQYLEWAGPTSAPLAWHFWSAASLIAAAARRNFWVDAGMDEPIYLCNYFFLVGPSGSGKSTAVKKARDILKRTNQKLTEVGLKRDPPQDITIYQSAASSSAAAWIEGLSTHYADVREVEEIDGSTSLEPVMVLRPDCCCYIAQDEAVVLLGKSSFEGERWFDMLFQLSDCPEEWKDEKLNAQREGKNRELYNVALTCLFGSAPEHLMSRVSSAIFSGGFIGRTIISHRTHSGKMHSSRADTDPVIAEELSSALARLAQMPRRRLHFSPQAREWYDGFLEENHHRIQECDPRFVGAYERAGWHICKTAGMLTLAEGIVQDEFKTEIPLRLVQLAKEIVELERPGAELIVGSIRPSSESDQLEAVEREIIRAGQIDYTTLLRRCRYAVTTTKQLNLFLDTLLQSQKIKRTKGAKGQWVIMAMDYFQESNW